MPFRTTPRPTRPCNVTPHLPHHSCRYEPSRTRFAMPAMPCNSRAAAFPKTHRVPPCRAFPAMPCPNRGCAAFPRSTSPARNSLALPLVAGVYLTVPAMPKHTTPFPELPHRADPARWCLTQPKSSPNLPNSACQRNRTAPSLATSRGAVPVRACHTIPAMPYHAETYRAAPGLTLPALPFRTVLTMPWRTRTYLESAGPCATLPAMPT